MSTNNSEKVKRKVGRPRKNNLSENSITSTDSQNTVIKKKRGRKPKPKTEEDLLPKIPKKRGRKPKPKTEEDLKEKIPKKRGRKPKERIYNINLLNNANSDNIEQNNIILHLPFNSSVLADNRDMLSEDILKYDPELKEPLPYAPNNQHQSDYEIISSKLKEQINNLNENDSVTNNDINENNEDMYDDNELDICINSNNNDIKCNSECKSLCDSNKKNISKNNDCYNTNYLSETGIDIHNKDIIKAIKEIKIYNLMSDFSKNLKNEWIMETNIACYWCCHSFNSIPIGIPMKYVKDTFYLWGCFCSFNCAAAYIFNEQMYDKWEKYSLLHLLYNKLTKNNCSKIKLAPSRHLLKMFGGKMNIDDFRNASLQLNKYYNIITTPLISIIPQMEEINFTPIEKSINIHTDSNSINEGTIDKSSLKLFRNKPISKKSNTLENYMSLKIV